MSENRGRPRKDKRSVRAIRAYDDEWEIIRRVSEIVKQGKFSAVTEFVETIERSIFQERNEYFDLRDDVEKASSPLEVEKRSHELKRFLKEHPEYQAPERLVRIGVKFADPIMLDCQFERLDALVNEISDQKEKMDYRNRRECAKRLDCELKKLMKLRDVPISSAIGILSKQKAGSIEVPQVAKIEEIITQSIDLYAELIDIKSE